MASRKPTRQQAVVLDKLSEVSDFTSAQDLHARLRAEGSSVGLATVYRALQSFATNGSVDMLRTDEGEAVYRRCSTAHHHHLVCRQCGRTVEVAAPAIEEWAASVSDTHGFTEVTHHIEVFGTCPSCAAVNDAQQPDANQH